MHFAAKIHDIDGATISFSSLEIDQKEIWAAPGDRSRVAGVEGESAATELTQFDDESDSNNKIS